MQRNGRVTSSRFRRPKVSIVRKAGKANTQLRIPVPMAIAMFVTIWWILLFAVLPFGVQSQHETAEIVPGTDPGAPVATRMGRKLVWTTVLSAVIFAAAWLAYDAGYLNVERLSHGLGGATLVGPKPLPIRFAGARLRRRARPGGRISRHRSLLADRRPHPG